SRAPTAQLLRHDEQPLQITLFANNLGYPVVSGQDHKYPQNRDRQSLLLSDPWEDVQNCVEELSTVFGGNCEILGYPNWGLDNIVLFGRHFPFNFHRLFIV